MALTKLTKVKGSTKSPLDVGSLTALRALDPSFDGERFNLLSTILNQNVDGGVFYYDASDTTSADDNENIIVTTTNKRLKRLDDTFKLRQDLTSPDGVNLIGNAVDSRVLGDVDGDKQVGSSYEGSVFSDYQPSEIRKIGSFLDGATITTRRQALIASDGLYYINLRSSLPLVVPPASSPDAEWQCVGYLTGYPIWDLRNWDENDISNDISPALSLLLSKYPLFVSGDITTRSKPEIILPDQVMYMRSTVTNSIYEQCSFLRMRGSSGTVIYLSGSFTYALDLVGEFFEFNNFRIEDIDNLSAPTKIFLNHNPAEGRADCDATFNHIFSRCKFIHHVHGRGSQFNSCTIGVSASLARVSSPIGFIPSVGSTINDTSTAMRRYSATSTNSDSGFCIFEFDTTGDLAEYINEVTINGVYGHTLARLINNGYLNNVNISNVNVVNSFSTQAILCNRIRRFRYDGVSIRGYNTTSTPSGGTRMPYFLYVSNGASTTDTLIEDVSISGVISNLGESLVYCNGYIGNINISGLCMPHAYESSGSTNAVLVAVNGVTVGSKIRFSGCSINASSTPSITSFRVSSNLLSDYFDVSGLTINNLPYVAPLAYKAFTPDVSLTVGESVPVTNAFGRYRPLSSNTYLIEFGFVISSSTPTNSQLRISGVPVTVTGSGSVSSTDPSRAFSSVQTGYTTDRLSITVLDNEIRFWKEGVNVPFQGSDIVAGMALTFSTIVSSD